MKMNERVVFVLTLLLGVLCLPLTGCENKLTKENYDKVQVGMSVDEVTAILGPGEKMDSGAGTKVAQGMISDITLAQDRQNRSQIKQGLGDLTGKINDRDQQAQREAGGGTRVQKPQVQTPGAPGAAPGPRATIPPSPRPAETRNPVRTRWIWKTDRVEVTIDFSDDVVTTKNQDGL
ncbi:MAG: hypothetical protein ACREJD_05190 [Phycisphaerales bacterium]